MVALSLGYLFSEHVQNIITKLVKSLGELETHTIISKELKMHEIKGTMWSQICIRPLKQKNKQDDPENAKFIATLLEK